MNKNAENYKKAIDQIHIDEDLKEKVLENTKGKTKSRKPIYYLSYAASFAVIAIVAVVGIRTNFLKDFNKNLSKEKLDLSKGSEIVKENKEELLAKANIKRFSSMEELRETLEDAAENQTYVTNGVAFEDSVATAESTLSQAEKTNSTKGSEVAELEDTGLENYSKTNNQVENVDEADIVKTDGKYIYYCQNLRVYIYDNDLNLMATLDYEDGFAPRHIFINGDKLVVLGNNDGFNISYYEKLQNSENSSGTIAREKIKSIARIYDLTDIESPELDREISVDGRYNEARMIENNVYFVTTYGINIYGLKQLEDSEILPSYNDTLVSDEDITIEPTDIAHFENVDDGNYSIVAGFNLDKNEEVNIETFLGHGGEIYVSENNLYVVSMNYDDYGYPKDSTIYKFALKDGTVLALGSTIVEGQVNSQFSIDEYNGDLRIATTVYDMDDSEEEQNNRFIEVVKVPEYHTRLTIFNKDLEKIGEIENLIENEKVYGVRFIGEVGYIVTFESVDPLWVIDLSDPSNPVVRGELEIPGYSIYLHPWDNTHIIGIGYNVKDNRYEGGVTNDTLKLSMFDISDLNNPKEIFNISLPDELFSSITSDHKLLFINKERNLIGFPVYSFNDKGLSDGLILFNVDLENNKFNEIDDLVVDLEDTRHNTNANARFIYINDYIYGLLWNKIKKIDIDTFKKVKEAPVPSESKLEKYYEYFNSYVID